MRYFLGCTSTVAFLCPVSNGRTSGGTGSNGAGSASPRRRERQGSTGRVEYGCLESFHALGDPRWRVVVGVMLLDSSSHESGWLDVLCQDPPATARHGTAAGAPRHSSPVRLKPFSRRAASNAVPMSTVSVAITA